jgi:hypothetical protein
MADWNTVRNDRNYVEPLDPQIIPLCDALNAAGFATTSSCCGHGRDWPYVCFQHASDQLVEDLARFILGGECGDYRPYCSVFQKEIQLNGFAWRVEIHLNDVYESTPHALAMAQAECAIAQVTRAINAWQTMISSNKGAL